MASDRSVAALTGDAGQGRDQQDSDEDPGSFHEAIARNDWANVLWPISPEFQRPVWSRLHTRDSERDFPDRFRRYRRRWRPETRRAPCDGLDAEHRLSKPTLVDTNQRVFCCPVRF